ncbi:MAG: carboxymuconolactone decarboxylase family protein, partial [Pseudomonadota bacterium]
MTQSLQPLEPPYSPEVEQALSAYPRRDGYLLTLFRVFANSRRFVSGKGVLNLLDRDSPLPLRERELVILRTCANLRCSYEWGVHVAGFAGAASLSRAQYLDTAPGDPDPALWPARERALLAVVDALCGDARLTGATLAAFEAGWSVEQQLEVLALCGNYHTISFVANVSGIPDE